MSGSVEWFGQFRTAPRRSRFQVRLTMTATSFTVAFLAALLASLAVRYWLALRQIAHVRAHRDATPPAFAGRIDPASHRKAADYTVAQQRFGMLETAVDALVLVVAHAGRRPRVALRDDRRVRLRADSRATCCCCARSH